MKKYKGPFSFNAKDFFFIFGFFGSLPLVYYYCSIGHFPSITLTDIVIWLFSSFTISILMCAYLFLFLSVPSLLYILNDTDKSLKNSILPYVAEVKLSRACLKEILAIYIMPPALLLIISDILSYISQKYFTDNFLLGFLCISILVLGLIQAVKCRKAASIYSMVFYPVYLFLITFYYGIIALALKKNNAGISDISLLNLTLAFLLCVGILNMFNIIIYGLLDSKSPNVFNIQLKKMNLPKRNFLVKGFSLCAILFLFLL